MTECDVLEKSTEWPYAKKCKAKGEWIVSSSSSGEAAEFIHQRLCDDHKKDFHGAFGDKAVTYKES